MSVCACHLQARAEAYLSSVEAELVRSVIASDPKCCTYPHTLPSQADLKQKFREHTCFSRCLWEQTPASPSKPPLMSRSMPALSSPLSPRRVRSRCHQTYFCLIWSDVCTLACLRVQVSLVSRGGIPVTGRSSVTIPLVRRLPSNHLPVASLSLFFALYNPCRAQLP